MDLGNKKGMIAPFFLIMIGIMMFILSFALISPLITNSNAVQSTMGCNNVSIETYVKITCGIIDISSPFLIGIIMALGGIAITSRLIT